MTVENAGGDPGAGTDTGSGVETGAGTPAAPTNADPNATGGTPGAKPIEKPEPDATGKTSDGKTDGADAKPPKEGPVPYDRFHEVNERARVAETTLSQLDSFIAANPDLAEEISRRMRGESGPAKPDAPDADSLAKLRDDVASEISGIEGTKYEDLSPFERREIDREIEAKRGKESAEHEQRVANVSSLRTAIEKVGQDPIFRGIKIDADALVEHMDKSGIFNPRSAALDMHHEAILDRERRESAEKALRRKESAAGAALEPGGAGGKPAAPTDRYQEVAARVEQIRARKSK